MNNHEIEINGRTLTPEEIARVSGGEAALPKLIWLCDDCGAYGDLDVDAIPTECAICHSQNISVKMMEIDSLTI